MGVSTENLVIFGFEISYNDYKKIRDELDNYNDFDYRESSKGDLVLIGDGRSGKYGYVGYLVASSNDARSGREDFNKRIELNREDFEGRDGINLFVDDYGVDVEGEPNFHIFSHYR